MTTTTSSINLNVYVCSPLSAPTREGVMKNMEKAKEYCAKAVSYYDGKASAFAPHAYLPHMLDDNISWQRKLALDFGLAVLEQCDVIAVCGDRISNGMRGEIEKAKELGKEMIFIKD